MMKFKWLHFALCVCMVLGVFAPFAAGVSAANSGVIENTDESIDFLFTEYRSEEEKLATMKMLYEKDGCELFVQLQSGEVAVRDTKTGQTLFTNPYDIAVQDIAATQKQELLSQLLLTYRDGTNSYTMNSYADCALNDQIEVSRIRGGVRVQYTLGATEKRKLAPRQIAKERFEELILTPVENEKIDDKGSFLAQRLKNFYQLKDYNDPSLSAKAKQDLLTAYPVCQTMPIYVLTTDITNAELNNIQLWLQTYTDYSMDDMQRDHSETGYVMTDDSPPVFKMALEYYLEEGGFTVRLPARGISFDSSLYKLSEVRILPYFGAGLATDAGYTFIPDGGGAIIDFADVESTTTVSGRLYGNDYAFHSVSHGTMEIWRMPVYGVVSTRTVTYTTTVESETVDENGVTQTTTETVYATDAIPQGYVAFQTEGDSLTQLTSYHGGDLHPYNAVYATVYPRQSDSYPLEGITISGQTATYEVDSSRKYVGNYTTTYRFLWREEADYVGMATAYRNYLESKGVLTRLSADADENIPLYIESFGDIDTTAYFLGVPVTAKTGLTTFSQAQTMISLLKGKVTNNEDAQTVARIFPNAFAERDATIEAAQEVLDDYLQGKTISNLNLKYIGWYNGGMRNTPPSKLDIEGTLGGEEGLKSLVRYAKDEGVDLYMDLEFTFVNESGWFDAFDYGTDTAKTVEGKTALQKVYDPISQSFNTRGLSVITVNAISRFYSQIKAKYEALGTGTISVSSLGGYLNSDHDKNQSVNREESKQLLVEFLQQRDAAGQQILIDFGNAYTWAYADDILNVPLDSSARLATSADVPFVGIVLHGCKEFTGTSINLSGDYNYSVLKAIENGASPYFTLSFDNTSELKAAGFSQYYSIQYSIWFDDLIQTYETLNTALKLVRHAVIVDHREVADRVFEVSYDNGVKFLLNYNNAEVTYGDYTLDALGFVVE